MAKTHVPETAQRAADTYLELAQLLEREAARYREQARWFRRGELLTAYTNLPADAGDHVRHPAQRAIDGLSAWPVVEAVDRLRAELGAQKAVR